jgi:hypothetical protein
VTYIGSVKDAEKAMYLGSMALNGMKAKKAMSDERLEQERIQGFCPEGVEDFAARWFGAIAPVMAMVAASGHALPYLAVPREPATDEQMASGCVEAFKGLAEEMGAIGAAMNAAQQAADPAAQRIAELEALLRASEAALALATSTVRKLRPEPAQHPSEPLKRACSVWPGRGGVSQLTGKPLWV